MQENSQAAESAPEQEAGSSPETSTPEMANEEELTGKLVPETIEEIDGAEPVTAEDSALERSWKQSEELGSHITGLDIEDPEMITQVEKVGGVKGDETVPIKMEESEKHSSERSKEGPPDPASVKEVMKRTGSFFVNTFSAHQMNGALPYLMDTSYDRVISVSTINPGKNFFGRVSGTYDKDGVILKGGIITSFDKEDSSTGKTGDVAVTSPSGMSTTTFSREGRGQKALNMMDKVAMRRVKHPKKHTSLAYNEFVVRQPQTFGYFESMEPGKDGKIILTHQDLDSFRKRFVEASGRNLPMFALMPDRTFVRVKSIGEDGELVLGETLKPEQVYSEEETNS